jgi:hypothetical protein
VYDVADDDDDGEKDSTSCIAMNLATPKYVYTTPETRRSPSEDKLIALPRCMGVNRY